MRIKKVIRMAYRFMMNKKYRFSYLRRAGVYDSMPDEDYLKKAFRVQMGVKLNLLTPKTFNEKLQWLKLYNHNPEYTKMVDKIEMKKYVANIIGEEYVIPILGIWERPEEIDFEKLPKQFVLKCNHNSGTGMCICKDKSVLDTRKVCKELRKGLQEDYYLKGREWPYKNVKRMIFAEKFMVEESSDNSESVLTDYKFFCFSGEPKIMYISKDSAKDPRTDFFDMDFQHLPMRMKDPNSEILPQKPKQFDEMKEIARKLSTGIPHLRVDFYIINNQIYVGELTFFHNSGFSQINPPEWDEKLGEWIDLS